MMLRRPIGFIALLASTSLWAAPAHYSITDIGTLGAGISAHGINNNGDIAGEFAATDGSGANHAFFYQHRSRVLNQLSSFGHPVYQDVANGINDHGWIPGRTNGDSGAQAIVWYVTGGAQELWDAPVSIATAVNNAGLVVGLGPGPCDPACVTHALVWNWNDRSMTDLGTFGGFRSSAWAVSETGHVVGDADTSSHEDHAFLWQSGEMEDLGLLPGGTSAAALGVNDRDDVVGFSNTGIPAATAAAKGCPQCRATHAFLSRKGNMVDLGNLANVRGWDSVARATNNRQEIVGWADYKVRGADARRAFVYTGGKMYNLNFLADYRDYHVTLTDAVSINCHGWIAANGTDSRDNRSHVYLLIRKGGVRSECPKPK